MMRRPLNHPAHADDELPVSRIRPVDLLGEAVGGVLERPGRSALTALGTVLGVAVLIAVLGMTASASAQISKRFNPAVAFEVGLRDPGDTIAPRSYTFRPDTEQRIRALAGVRAVGISWMLTGPPFDVSTTPGRSHSHDGQNTTPVMAASPSLFEEAEATFTSGDAFTEFERSRAKRVVVLGPQIAQMAGITTTVPGQNIWLNGLNFEVVGILGTTQRHAEMLSAVVIPDTTARRLYRDRCGSGNFSIFTLTQPGAVDVVAEQLPHAVNPERATHYVVTKPPDPKSLQEAVNKDLGKLLVGLAAVSLVVGMVGIANTTFVAVIERTKEIGLRRSLGARRRHILLQYLLEAIILGGLGGLVGASVGTLTVVVTCATKQWTAVMDPRIAVMGPVCGLIVGGLAGIHPAWRASRIEPIEAMRQG